VIGVGASGALCGVLGAWVVFLALHWGHGSEFAQANRQREIVMTLFNVAVLFATSFIPNIDWAAHLGGLVGGSLLSLWYFGAALGGEPFAYDALSRAAAERKVAAAARALASANGAAAPALPSRLRGTRAGSGAAAGGAAAPLSPSNAAPLVGSSPSTAASNWGGGQRLDGREADAGGAPPPEPCCARTGAAVDAAAEAVCGPMPSVLAGCARDASPGLRCGAAVSLAALAAYFAMVCTLLGLIYGGFVVTDVSLLNVCPILAQTYPQFNLRCPF